jgi:uncharacterized protein (TIGR03435 family)
LKTIAQLQVVPDRRAFGQQGMCDRLRIETWALLVKLRPRTSVGNGIRVEHDCSMDDVRNILEGPSRRRLIDRTGLTGRYDFDLHWTPDDTPVDSPRADGPSIFTAVQEQLGLKFESATAPVEVLVIDSAQQPTPN